MESTILLFIIKWETIIDQEQDTTGEFVLQLHPEVSISLYFAFANLSS